MATTYTVVLHKGPGVIGGTFSTLALATTFVGSAPNCGYEIQAVVTDAAVGQVVAQGGPGIAVSTGPGLNNLGA